MTNETKSQKVLHELLDELDRTIIRETEWAKKGYDDAEFTKGQVDMAKEIREQLENLKWLMLSEFSE